MAPVPPKNVSFEYKQFYRRKLPHRNSPGATLFVTFRLFGSIPKNVIAKWKADRDELNFTYSQLLKQADATPADLARVQAQFQRRWFRKFEDALHSETAGPTWLANPLVAKEVADSMHFLHKKAYEMHAFCIMSNHVHWVFTPNLNERSLMQVKGSNPLKIISKDPPMAAIMQSIKGYSARQANKVLQRKGTFWEPESYDHEVRNKDEFDRIVRYVLNNPVKAGLVERWQDWKWNWRADQT